MNSWYNPCPPSRSPNYSWNYKSCKKDCGCTIVLQPRCREGQCRAKSEDVKLLAHICRTASLLLWTLFLQQTLYSTSSLTGSASSLQWPLSSTPSLTQVRRNVVHCKLSSYSCIHTLDTFAQQPALRSSTNQTCKWESTQLAHVTNPNLLASQHFVLVMSSWSLRLGSVRFSFATKALIYSLIWQKVWH